MAKSVETVETLANIGQYSPLVITFIVADRHDPFFFLFFPSQHIRFAETRPFSVFLSFFLRPSFLLLVVNARVYRANNRSSGHTETRGGGGGALSRRDSSSSWSLVSRNASTKGA